MRARLPIAIALMLALASSCTGGDGGGDEAARADEGGAQTGAARRRALRAARMQVETRWAEGALAAFCAQGRCTEDPAAAPERFVRAGEDGLIAFVVGRRPAEATVAFARASSGRVAEEATPHPGTYMAVQSNLRPGRYVVTLRARWAEREARWLFGLRVEPD